MVPGQHHLGPQAMSTRATRRPWAGMLPLVAMSLLSCAGLPPTNLGVSASGLAPCPPSPNCVSSDATDTAHAIPPFQLGVPPPEAWQTARDVVAALPRTRIVHETSDYLHAECKSTLIGFVDDLELHLRAPAGIIAVRSASRVGYSDLGVNRRRVEGVRAALAERGVLR